jgi:quercetin dioxygenase-like cupin family protein
MSNSPVFALEQFPAHLGLGATVEREPRFTGGGEWYEAYGSRHEKDGVEGRLVSMHSFDKPWDSWEMHPKGGELVVCTAGTITLHQEIDGKVHTVTLRAGEAVINPPGVWHTADVDAPCTALFVTAGLGTEIRPR